MERSRRLGLAAAILTLGALVSAGADTPPVDPGRLGGQAPQALTPSEQAAILDKPRIAEDTLQRVEGLREAGNPHILQGLLIANLREDPDRVKVDLDQLHEDAERRMQTEPNELLSLAPPGVVQLPSPILPQGEMTGSRSWNMVLAVLGVTLLAAGGLVLALKC